MITKHQPWEHIWSRPVLMQDYDNFVFRSALRLSRNKVPTIMAPRSGKWEAWHPQPQFNRFMEILGREIIAPDYSIKKYTNQFNVLTRQILHSAKILGSVSYAAPLSQWLIQYKDFQNIFLRFGEHVVWQPWSITYFVEDWMTHRLQKYFDDWQAMYDIIARAPKPYQTQRMIEAVWGWRANKGTPAALDIIVKRYQYLGVYSINHSVWTKRGVLQQAGSLKNAEAQLRHAQTERKKTQRLFRNVYYALCKKDSLLARVAEAVHVFVWLRTERIDVYKKVTTLIQPFYRQLEKRLGWETGWSAHLTVQEMELLLRGRTPVTRDELKRRHERGYIGYVHKDGSEVISDPREQKRFLKNIIGDQTKHEDIVTGKIACPGKIVGTVKVLLHAQAASKFPKGAILVAHMTHPDYMPAIRRAAAIVTDEGGIVCHAAVISRELNIPCVIATKHATKIFADGDRVEVDAIRGIVRKLG